MKPLPRWAKVLDLVALILVASTFVALSHPIRFVAGDRSLTIREWWRPALVAALLIAIRHWRISSPNLAGRIARGLRAWRSEPNATILRTWAVSRFGVLLVAIFAVLAIGIPEGSQRISTDPILDLPSRWDVPWYSGIAREGYSYDERAGAASQQTVAFFPAYPVALWVADAFTQPERTTTMSLRRYLELRDSRIAWAGTAISIACFLYALLLLYRWAERRIGPEEAMTAVVLLAAYPFSVFFSAAYTESLFLLGTIGACLAFERERWVVASAFGLLVGLTRPNGCMLSVTLAILACVPWFSRAAARSMGWLLLRLTVAAMPGIGMLLHSAYIYSITGDAFAWLNVQQAWGRNFGSSRDYAWWTVRALSEQGVLFWIESAPLQILQTVAALFALVMAWPVWRRIGPAYAVLVLTNVLPPLLQGGVLSMGRLTSTLFPVFAALAATLPANRRDAWILLFGLGQGLIAVLFFTWRPLY